jgi:hypothetical protein
MKKERGFRKFLRKGGKSDSIAERLIAGVREFEEFLKMKRKGRTLESASPKDLEAFVEWIEQKSKTGVKETLRGIGYYNRYTSNERMRNLAALLREQRIEKAPFALRGFGGIDPCHIERLCELGIRNIDQMLEAGKTKKARQELSEKANIPPQVILELVKLSDLSRIFGVKGTRARLYHDAGIDTVEKISTLTPEELRRIALEFVERTGFAGIATLPAEAQFTVAAARKLSKIVEY